MDRGDNYYFNQKRLEIRATTELIGIAKGLIADGKLDEQEADFLCSFLSNNTEYYDSFPFNILFDRIEVMLSDNVIDEDERKELFEILTELAGEKKVKEKFEDFATTLPLTKPCPKIFICNRTYCFTGTFLYGNRKDCEKAILDRGGFVNPYVTMDLKYLVIGSKPTKDWKQSSFGNKILKAMDYNENKNCDIAIISEKDWLEAIKKVKPVYFQEVKQPEKKETYQKQYARRNDTGITNNNFEKKQTIFPKILCPHCQQEIKTKENICPNCGANISNIQTNKIIFKGAAFFLIAMFTIVMLSYTFFGDENKKPKAENTNTKYEQVAVQEQITLPGTPLEFTLLDDYKVIQKPSTGRHRLEMTILPNGGQETATQADLISTVMHVAHEAYKKTGVPVIEVNMLAQNTGNAWADRQLAFIVYFPDKKGYDGKQEIGIWDNAMACERGFTTDELTYLQLWGKLRTKYLDPASGTIQLDKEKALDAEIVKTMGKKLETDPMLNVMWAVEIK